MGELGQVEDQPGCCILDELQKLDGTRRQPSQERVAVALVRDDKSLDQDLCHLLGDEWTYPLLWRIDLQERHKMSQ